MASGSLLCGKSPSLTCTIPIYLVFRQRITHAYPSWSPTLTCGTSSCQMISTLATKSSAPDQIALPLAQTRANRQTSDWQFDAMSIMMALLHLHIPCRHHRHPRHQRTPLKGTHCVCFRLYHRLVPGIASHAPIPFLRPIPHSHLKTCEYSKC